jgi:CHAD domain-containing protein
VNGPAPELGEAPAPLRPTDSFAQAARAAMWPQVDRLLAIEPALHDPNATDDLKRYRVATRRLRAALRVFDEALPKRAVKDIQPELAELARAVGRVRDLDVRAGGLPDGDGVQPLRDAWAAERAAAADEMGHRLGTRRHARLLAGLAALVSAPEEGAPPSPGRRAVRDRVGSAVWTGFERRRGAATGLDGADLEALHDLRIRAKRLRYTLEFLGPVLGADRAWLVGRLVELLDHLGALNDASLAAAAARAFLDAAPPLADGQRTAIEGYLEAQAATVERLRRGVPKALNPIVEPAFVRRLAGAVLGPDVPATAHATTPKGARAAKPAASSPSS